MKCLPKGYGQRAKEPQPLHLAGSSTENCSASCIESIPLVPQSSERKRDALPMNAQPPAGPRSGRSYFFEIIISASNAGSMP